MRPNRTLVVTAVVLLLILGAGAYFLHKSDINVLKGRVGLGPKIVAKVGSHLITQDELDQAYKGNTLASKDKVLSALMDMWLYRQMAQPLKIAVTDSDVKTELAKRVGSSTNSKNYLTVAVTRDLLSSKLEDYYSGYSQGRYIIAHFDQHIPFNGGDNTGAGTTAQIAADRTYATNFINNVYDKLSKKQITFDQAVAMENADARIGSAALQTSPHSGSFDTTDSVSAAATIMSFPDVAPVIAGLAPGKISQPFVSKIAVAAGENPPKVDGCWLVVVIDRTEPKNGQTFNGAVASAKSTLRYEKYS
ncbi:MAG TPA: hypothetical protein VLF41_00875 [Candidatus Nanoarchaeia archaeon]|nr:hypothetical protein [Candidatus Nanoarchaeia archaeon]